MVAMDDARRRRRDGEPRRADAERNVTAILDAAQSLFRSGADASMTEIARVAGVGRVTLYGHFASREDLVRALLTRATGEAEELIAGAGLDDGPAPEALARLVRDSWRSLDQHRGLHAAAARVLTPEQLRAHHEGVLGHVDRLVERGRRSGAFRTDLPRPWLVATVFGLMHTAADEVDAGRLDPDAAGATVLATVLAVLQPPG
jgi:TetR/AcrR family transcriptional regulator, mexCD-oprJ operon repressor